MILVAAFWLGLTAWWLLAFGSLPSLLHDLVGDSSQNAGSAPGAEGADGLTWLVVYAVALLLLCLLGLAAATGLVIRHDVREWIDPRPRRVGVMVACRCPRWSRARSGFVLVPLLVDHQVGAMG
ncbi:hypothetical protein ACH4GK_34355 [Streptomyces rimosus]|uniref:hypothetical protein n=1 Tax=Streptomyces rimosus TaxID=1927 RepID=UPI0004C7AC8D|nr:hypothetical protein [Streptomyces rimosus]